MTLSEFLHMGGYGFYVWFSYGLTFAILLINLVVTIQRGRNVRRDVAKRAGAAR